MENFKLSEGPSLRLFKSASFRCLLLDRAATESNICSFISQTFSVCFWLPVTVGRVGIYKLVVLKTVGFDVLSLLNLKNQNSMK